MLGRPGPTFAVMGHSGASAVLSQAATEDDLWQQFASHKEVPAAQAAPSAPSAKGGSWCGGVVQHLTLGARASAKLTFVLSWHFPNRVRDLSVGAGTYDSILPAVLGNQYDNWFADSLAVATYMAAAKAELQAKTRLYRDTIFASTLPPDVVDSAAGRVACLRSATMWWTKGGVVMGTEGNGT